MSTVQKLAEEISKGLKESNSKLNKPVVRKLSLAVGAMIEARTPNTVELANLLPLEIERQDMREQWLRRLLSSPALNWTQVIAPFAKQLNTYHNIKTIENLGKAIEFCKQRFK